MWWSIQGMYEYDPTVFEGFDSPSFTDSNNVVHTLNRDDVINNILLQCAELEVVYPSIQMMKFAIGVWSASNQEAWDTAKNMVNQIGGAWNSSIIPGFLWEYRYVVILFAVGMLIHWLPTRIKRWYRVHFALMPVWVMILIAVLTIILVYQFITADMQPFIYFQF